MRMPKRPPDVIEIERLVLESSGSKRYRLIIEEAHRTEAGGEYLHWDTLRHLTPPANLTHEEWWLGIKTIRFASRKEVPLQDKKGAYFYYNITNLMVQQLHEIDLLMGGSLPVPEPLRNPHTREQYLVRSLIQEAISSSQLEGAATTREVAKEMLRSGRLPKDQNEQMILNNFLTMQQIHSWKNLPLTESLVFEIHKQITEGALDQSDASGRFRREDESIIIEETKTKEILYQPPDAKELLERFKAMSDFASGKTPDHFMHPVIRAIVLHFWLAYDHPFVDGNGRTARALFYWILLRHEYWLFEFISISEVLLFAPAQYGMAFLQTETDGNDLTYFLVHQMGVIQKALQSMNAYVKSKAQEIEWISKVGERFNPRQEALVMHALHHPAASYTVESHKTSHQVAYDTARKDLLDLHQRGFLQMRKKGKAFVFKAASDLAALVNI